LAPTNTGNPPFDPGHFVKVIVLAVPVFLFCSGINAAMGQGYTEAQALRGQAHYYQHCLNCHGETMNGLDQASPLAGPQFSGIWNGETLWALLARIGTMPPDKPGSLSRDENVDILTYMLWFNGIPMGTEALGTEQGTLGKLKFQTPIPGQ